jgi:molybdopterin synthase catalytic subunit
MSGVQVTVRLFAMLRQRAGADEVVLDLPAGARVRDALAELGELAQGLPLVLAVNREYAPHDQVLDGGDELALIPPVSGGSVGAAGRAGRVHARVSAEPLAVDPLLERVRDSRAGAVVSFQGVTRTVERLEYEAYAEMARERLAAIAAETSERHGLCAAAVEHRVGPVELSEPSVVVAASAPHRPEAFAGARELIDRVKAEAPIWKREVEGERERWVEGTSPTVGGAVAGEPALGPPAAGGPGRATVPVDVEVRCATPADLPAVAAIYAAAVEVTPATFDLEAKPLEWWEATLAAAAIEEGHELLVAVAGGKVLGYARSAEHRAKAAYRATVEVSIYLAEGHRGRRVGTALYRELLGRLDASGARVAVAGVTQPNEASHRLHCAHGFTEVGTFRGVGVKFGRAWDVRWYERRLDGGSEPRG